MNGQAGRPSGKQLRKWRIQDRCNEDKAQMLFLLQVEMLALKLIRQSL